MVSRAEKRARKLDAKRQVCEMAGRAVNDEVSGIMMYTEMASLAKQAGMKGAAKTARMYSHDEAKHNKGMARIRASACGVKGPKPLRHKKRCPHGVITRGPRKGRCRK
jgi:rubrerythrin